MGSEEKTVLDYIYIFTFNILTLVFYTLDQERIENK